MVHVQLSLPDVAQLLEKNTERLVDFRPARVPTARLPPLPEVQKLLVPRTVLTVQRHLLAVKADRDPLLKPTARKPLYLFPYLKQRNIPCRAE